MNDAQELRRITVFSDLKNAELEWLADHGEFRDLDTGDAAVEEGSPADVMLAVIEGELRGRGEKKAFDGVVVAVRAGEISGMLPFSRMKTFPVTSRAIVPSRLVFFPASLFPEMLERVPVLEPRLIAALADRVRKMTRDVQHRDALMALGKLSAGLAHELNNPPRRRCARRVCSTNGCTSSALASRHSRGEV